MNVSVELLSCCSSCQIQFFLSKLAILRRMLRYSECKRLAPCMLQFTPNSIFP